MKLGFLSAILYDMSFEEVIDYASETGYEAVEIACWPTGKAERRYAGVTHIDVENLDESKIEYIKDYCKKKNVNISGLAYYPNNMDGDKEKRAYYNEHLLKVIDAADKLGVGLVNTFIGRDKDKNLEDNLTILKEVWPPILEYAEKKNVLIGIENCPMIFTYDEWPGGNNLASSAHNFRLILDKLGYPKNLGLNYDPSHHILQGMDYLKPFYEFKNRIFHLHIKDMKLDKNKLDDYGFFAPPNFYSIPKIPGHGEVNWAQFISSAMEVGFKGYACVEIEDRSFEDSKENRLKSLDISYRYLRNFI